MIPLLSVGVVQITMVRRIVRPGDGKVLLESAFPRNVEANRYPDKEDCERKRGRKIESFDQGWVCSALW